jgi:hypothetical protein
VSISGETGCLHERIVASKDENLTDVLLSCDSVFHVIGGFRRKLLGRFRYFAHGPSHRAHVTRAPNTLKNFALSHTPRYRHESHDAHVTETWNTEKLSTPFPFFVHPSMPAFLHHVHVSRGMGEQESLWNRVRMSKGKMPQSGQIGKPWKRFLIEDRANSMLSPFLCLFQSYTTRVVW